MFAPVIQSLISRHGWPVLTAETLEGFFAAHGEVVLFFSGDAERLDESSDVAVILPEILKVFGGRVTAAAVARDFERDLQRRYRFAAFPALVFLRGGEYLGAVSRMKDWDVYLSEIAEILSREPSEPPPFKLPDGSAARALQ
jgi:hydrogenase-1 operon protein HyaE